MINLHESMGRGPGSNLLPLDTLQTALPMHCDVAVRNLHLFLVILWVGLLSVMVAFWARIELVTPGYNTDCAANAL